jgi:hypothetical protein
MNEFFPLIEPYDSGFLQVSSIHSIYYEQSGNKEGKPVVYLHGGMLSYLMLIIRPGRRCICRRSKIF